MSQILTLNGNVVTNGNNVLTAPESTSLEANKNVSLVGGTTIVEPSTGYDAMVKVTATVPTGTATPAASIAASGASMSVNVNANTLTLNKTVSNTPQVTAGYVSSGTSGSSSVSLTASVTTKAAATITPTTTNQTISSGTYLTGTQTISGDANLVAGNIKKDVSIFGVTGTYEVSFSTIRTGSGAPSSSLGVDGDIYIQTS